MPRKPSRDVQYVDWEQRLIHDCIIALLVRAEYSRMRYAYFLVDPLRELVFQRGLSERFSSMMMVVRQRNNDTLFMLLKSLDRLTTKVRELKRFDDIANSLEWVQASVRLRQADIENFIRCSTFADLVHLPEPHLRDKD